MLSSKPRVTGSPPLKPGPSSFAASSCWRENSPFSQGFGKKKYRDFSQIYFIPTGQNCSNNLNYFVAFERFSTFARWCTCSRLDLRSNSAARCGYHLITWFTRLSGKPRIMYVAWAPLEKWTRFLQYSCPWMTSQPQLAVSRCPFLGFPNSETEISTTQKIWSLLAIWRLFWRL